MLSFAFGRRLSSAVRAPASCVFAASAVARLSSGPTAAAAAQATPPGHARPPANAVTQPVPSPNSARASSSSASPPTKPKPRQSPDAVALKAAAARPHHHARSDAAREAAAAAAAASGAHSVAAASNPAPAADAASASSLAASSASLAPTAPSPPLPTLSIPHALRTILELVDRPTSAVEAAFSKTAKHLPPKLPKPRRVPASVQIGVMDDVIDSFDPTIARAKAGDPEALADWQRRRDTDSVEQFLAGREVVVEESSPYGNFSLGDSRFSPTEHSGSLDPDILHSIVVQGASETDLKPARRTAIQISLSELMDVAAKYQQRAVEQSHTLHTTLSSPLAKRALPNVSARSESASALKSRQLKELESVFDVVEARGWPTAFHFTIMINAYAREGFVADAERLFADMLASKDDPVATKRGNFFPDTTAANSMIDMYSRTLREFIGSRSKEAEKYTEAARAVIRTMSSNNIPRDGRTFTSMMHVLCSQVVHSTRERGAALIKESLELFEYMQTPAGGGIRPNRRAYAILSQALTIQGDFLAAKALLVRMMTSRQIFPSMAIMNGWLKAAAYAAGRQVVLPADGHVGKSLASKPDLTNIQAIVSLMRAYHMAPNEHSVVSVMRGLAQTGQVQAALELHNRLEDGSLGAARPTRMTYTALLSLLLHDHLQPMSTCLTTFDRALSTPGIFRSMQKRRGSLLDLRPVGNHPELYALALTKQLKDFLQRYMQLEDQMDSEPLPLDRKERSPARREKRLLDQLVPERGWLILTGRHAGDMELTMDPDSTQGLLLPTGFDSPDGSALDLAPPLDLSGLRDEFPDDADYSEFDTTGILKREAKKRAKKGHPKLPADWLKGAARVAGALNTHTSIPVSNSYGRAASKFLAAQTPSIATTLSMQFAKEPRPSIEAQRASDMQKEVREARRAEMQAKGLDPDAGKVPFHPDSPLAPKQEASAAPGSAGAAASTAGSASSSSSSSSDVSVSSSSSSSSAVATDDAGRRVFRDPGPPKTDEKNEGCLLVRRPTLHFWLQCHSYVIRWHARAKQERTRVIEEQRLKLQRDPEAAEKDPPPPPPSAVVVVPPPPFLVRQTAAWWRVLCESIELQHGLAQLRSTHQQSLDDLAEEEAKRKYAAWRAQNAWKGTRRDGTVAEPKGAAAAAAAAAPASSSSAPSSGASRWSVRNRERRLVPQKTSKKRKPKITVL